MPRKEPTPEEREAQFQAFVEASRELECDEDPEALKAAVRKLAKAPISASDEGGTNNA